MRVRRYHIIIGAFLFALLMWISINMGDEYQLSLDVPLTIQNIPAGKALSTPVPRTLTLRVRSTGWRLASLLLSGEPQCVLNISSLRRRTIVTDRDLLNNMNIPGGIQSIDVSLDTLVLDLDLYVERKVPVIPDITMEFREGYGVIGEMQVKPDSVMIRGAESIVRGAKGWKTERQVFSDVREPITATIAIEVPHAYFVSVSPKDVQLSVNVQPLAEKTFGGLPVKAVATPPNREIIFIPPKMDIIARGGIEQLTALSEHDFRLSVNYQTLVRDTTGFVQPHLESPPGIRVIAKRPEQVQYIIRKRL